MPAVAGCPACAKSVSGICVQHNAPSVEGHARQCTGTTAAGARCKRWALENSEPPKCAVHVDDAEAAELARKKPGQMRSDKMRAARAVHNALDALGRPYEEIDSLEKLEALAAESLDFMAYLREQMKQAIDSDTDVDRALARYVSALDRTGKLLETFSKQGLQEREIRMREELTGLVSGLFNTILATYIPLEFQPAAQAALSNAVATLQPKALTA